MDVTTGARRALGRRVRGKANAREKGWMESERGLGGREGGRVGWKVKED